MENMTAKMSCFARAYHRESRQSPIFDDTAAKALLGGDYDAISQSIKDGIRFFLPDYDGTAENGLRLAADGQLSPSVVGRSAFCERKLKTEIRLGCRQYIIFASGYDTFAVRNKNDALSVFELDTKELFCDKARRISDAGLQSRAVCVPFDLAREGWAEGLVSVGFRPDIKSFGSLLGISCYLEKSAFSALLKNAGGLMSDGSAICFDYLTDADCRVSEAVSALASAAGENMKSRYSCAEIELLLSDCGFIVCEHLSGAELTAQYFTAHNAANPTHTMKAPDGVSYILAVRKK